MLLSRCRQLCATQRPHKHSILPETKPILDCAARTRPTVHTVYPPRPLPRVYNRHPTRQQPLYHQELPPQIQLQQSPSTFGSYCARTNNTDCQTFPHHAAIPTSNPNRDQRAPWCTTNQNPVHPSNCNQHPVELATWPLLREESRSHFSCIPRRSLEYQGRLAINIKPVPRNTKGGQRYSLKPVPRNTKGGRR